MATQSRNRRKCKRETANNLIGTEALLIVMAGTAVDVRDMMNITVGASSKIVYQEKLFTKHCLDGAS